MSWFQFSVTYLVSWWMTLFFVLPWGVKAPENPGPGHVPSAPDKPRLGRKFAITAVLALIPTLIIMGIANAYAATGVYHAGVENGACPPPANLAPTPDIAPATIDAKEQMRAADVPMSVDIPASPYTTQGSSGHGNGNSAADLSDSYLHVGVAGVDENGQATLNGHPIAAPDATREGCKP